MTTEESEGVTADDESAGGAVVGSVVGAVVGAVVGSTDDVGAVVESTALDWAAEVGKLDSEMGGTTASDDGAAMMCWRDLERGGRPVA